MRHVYFTAVVIGLMLLITGCPKIEDVGSDDIDFSDSLISVTGKPLSVVGDNGNSHVNLGICILKDDKTLLCLALEPNRLKMVSVSTLIKAEIADNDDQPITVRGKMALNSKCLEIEEVIVEGYNFSF